MPPEWLRESKQNVLLEAYQKSEWRPLFITSRFDVSQGGQALLRKLAHLEAEAIDPRPFQVEVLNGGVQNLQRMKAALKAVDPNCSDTPAEFQDSPSLDGAAARSQVSAGQQAGNGQASTGQQAAHPAPDPALLRGEGTKIPGNLQSGRRS